MTTNAEFNEHEAEDECRLRIIVALASERQRCMRIVSFAQPDLSNIHGMALQTMNAHDYMVLLRKAINNEIAEGPTRGDPIRAAWDENALKEKK